MNTLTFDEQVALLTKDLSGRLPYKVIISHPHTSYILGSPNTRENAVLTGIDPILREYSVGSKYTRISGLHIVLRGRILIKPYLRPMSSMTEEEKREFSIFIGKTETYRQQICLDSDSMCNPIIGGYKCVYWGLFDKCIDWLNAHHFDYRGLIPLGLAIDVTTLEDNPYNDEFIY